jgi:hypothetical protein
MEVQRRLRAGHTPEAADQEEDAHRTERPKDDPAGRGWLRQPAPAPAPGLEEQGQRDRRLQCQRGRGSLTAEQMQAGRGEPYDTASQHRNARRAPDRDGRHRTQREGQRRR